VGELLRKKSISGALIAGGPRHDRQNNPTIAPALGRETKAWSGFREDRIKWVRSKA